MKLFLSILLVLTSFSIYSASKTKSIEAPTVIGKIIKTKHEKEGTNYFIVYNRNGKDLAFPISPDSKVRNLHKYIGETVKVFGKTSFKKSDRKEVSYLMYFEVEQIKGLSLKDLEYTPDMSKEDEVSFYLTKQQGATAPGVKFKGINDKVANTAIFVGGAILAAEVLSQIFLKK